MIKRLYVQTIRTLRPLAARSGLIRRLDQVTSRNRAALWLRSLFAIYDIDDMVALDLPWWNLRATRRVDQFLQSRTSARVFEYGSGASSIWLARRAGEVISVEHDPVWLTVVAENLKPFANAELCLVEADVTCHPDQKYRSMKPGWEHRSFFRYASSIDGYEGLFDLIVVDGRARAECLRHARKKLLADGIILFDNSGRRRYRDAITQSGFDRQRFRGLTACLPYPDETTPLTASASAPLTVGAATA